MTSITTTGIEEVKKRLQNIASLNFTPALKQSIEELKTEYSERSFAQQGSNLGSRWQRRKDRLGHPLLNKTGKMKGSFQTRTTSKQAVVYNTANYFPYHQLGTRTIPQRPMMGLTAELQKKVGLIFGTYIKRYLSK